MFGWLLNRQMLILSYIGNYATVPRTQGSCPGRELTCPRSLPSGGLLGPSSHPSPRAFSGCSACAWSACST